MNCCVSFLWFSKPDIIPEELSDSPRQLTNKSDNAQAMKGYTHSYGLDQS